MACLLRRYGASDPQQEEADMFTYGQKVVLRTGIVNDGSFPGKEQGELLGKMIYWELYYLTAVWIL